MAGIFYLGGGREGQQNKREGRKRNRKVACFCSETRRSTAIARGEIWPQQYYHDYHQRQYQNLTNYYSFGLGPSRRKPGGSASDDLSRSAGFTLMALAQPLGSLASCGHPIGVGGGQGWQPHCSPPLQLFLFF
jgi:hypothetical protein